MTDIKSKAKYTDLKIQIIFEILMMELPNGFMENVNVMTKLSSFEGEELSQKASRSASIILHLLHEYFEDIGKSQLSDHLPSILEEKYKELLQVVKLSEIIN